MSSADLMTRNLDRRVELLIPILDEDCKQRVIDVLELCLKDNVKARRILSDGRYESVPTKSQAVRSQEELQRQATEAAESAVERKRMMFTPQSPQ
jgi:polyphosphate kinase